MQLDVEREVAALERMTVGQLRERFGEVFGEQTNARHKQWLIKRIAWKMQANIEGDISERARRRAAELSKDVDMRTSAPKQRLTPSKTKRRFEFSVCTSVDAKQLKAAGKASVSGRGAACPGCSHHVPTSFLQEQCRENLMGDRLYAKRVTSPNGTNRYEACTADDELRASSCTLRSIRGRKQKELPSEPFDENGMRHLWAMQYGIRSTADLFNLRQGIALLEVQAEIERAFGAVDATGLNENEQKALKLLLTLILNRLLMYNSRHSWWQPKGEFPANIFVRQAIPMVWSYVEMPVDSPAAGGFSSALKWICLVAEHCRKLPRRGRAAMADAAHCDLADNKR